MIEESILQPSKACSELLSHGRDRYFCSSLCEYGFCSLLVFFADSKGRHDANDEIWINGQSIVWHHAIWLFKVFVKCWPNFCFIHEVLPTGFVEWLQETAFARKACIKHHYFAIWNPLASSTLRMGRLQMTKTGLQMRGTIKFCSCGTRTWERIYHTCFVLAIMFRMLQWVEWCSYKFKVIPLIRPFFPAVRFSATAVLFL